MATEEREGVGRRGGKRLRGAGGEEVGVAGKGVSSITEGVRLGDIILNEIYILQNGRERRIMKKGVLQPNVLGRDDNLLWQAIGGGRSLAGSVVVVEKVLQSVPNKAGRCG